MELINDRFKIVKKIKSTDGYDKYLCSDLWDHNRNLILNIVEKNKISNDLYDFFINNFIVLAKLKDNSLIKNYNFNLVSKIDNKKSLEEKFMYTCEYVKKHTDLLDYTRQKDAYEIMELFIQISKTVHYLHVNGFSYGGINFENIYIHKEANESIIKIKDIATLKLDNEMNLIDENAILLTNTDLLINGKAKDMYDLGILFISMIIKKPFKWNWMDEVKNLENNLLENIQLLYTKKEFEFFKKIKPVIIKLLSFGDESSYKYIYEAIDEINHLTGMNYNIVAKENFSGPNYYTSLIGRHKNIDEIEKSYDDMIELRENKNIFFIEGASGIGKTRVLKEIDFRLRLKGAKIYSSYKLDELSNDKELWEDIFSELTSNVEESVIKEFKSDIKALAPEIQDVKISDLIDSHSGPKYKYKFLNRIASFIVKIISGKTSVVIIDNIELASEFTIDILKYVYFKIVKDENIMFIFSWDKNKSQRDKEFFDFLSVLKNKSTSKTIELKNFSIKETGMFIKNVLSIDYIPELLSEKIYSKSYGNPLFITEIIKDLYFNERIYVSKRTGLWHVDFSKYGKKYNELYIPSNIEQVLLSQLEGITYKDNKVLNTISIALNPISLEGLVFLLNEDIKVIEKIVIKLLDRGIIEKDFLHSNKVYKFTNRVLKDIIYNRIPEEEKIQIHKLCAKTIEKNYESGLYVDLNGLIYHFEGSKEKLKIKKYLIDSANLKYKSRNIKGAIEELEKAIDYISEKEITAKKYMMLKIADMYLDIESISDVESTLKRINNFPENTKEKEISLRVYIIKAETYNIKGNYEKAQVFIDKGYEILNYTDNLKLELRLKAANAIIFYRRGKFEKLETVCNEIIDRSENKYDKVSGNAYRLLALVYVNSNKFEKAIKANKKSIEIYESVGYIRGVVYSLNNIGTIYLNNYQNSPKALDYYKKIINLSRQYELVSGEIVALANIGVIYYGENSYIKSSEYFEKALSKALKKDYQENVLFIYRALTNVYLALNNFGKAYEFYKISKEKTDETNKQALSELALLKAEIYYMLGDLNEALEYNSKSLDYFVDEISSVHYEHRIEHYIIKIKMKNEGNYDEYVNKIIDISSNMERLDHQIIQLAEVSEELYEKKDFKNFNKIFLMLEKLVNEKTKSEAKSYFYYVKGLMSEHKKRLDLWEKACKLAKISNNRLHLNNIKIKIGDYHYNQNNYYRALDYYINSAEDLKKIINSVPDKFKLSFVNKNKYYKIYNRISYMADNNFEENIDLNKFSKKQEDNKVNNLKELNNLLTQDYNIFLENKEFMRKYTSAKIKEKDIFDEKSILINLQYDIIGNLDLILEYIINVTLATSAMIVLENKNEELKILSSTGEKKIKAKSRYYFKTLKKVMDPIFISGDFEQKLWEDSFEASAYIPIATGYPSFYLKKDSMAVPKVLGYLYLESTNILNNFNKEILTEKIGLINLISLLCEKHKLRNIALIDKLTGALTRKYLEDEIKNSISLSYARNRIFSIIMCDVDRFKRVNDNFGHQAGDEILRDFSKIVINNIDKTATFGRYGGEEFIIILPGADSKEALKIAELVRGKVHNGKLLGDRLPVTVSCGIATYPLNGTTTKELIEKADQALYIAKENGRNRCEIWKDNYQNKNKPISKLEGIITGDDLKDGRNILAIIETSHLMNSTLNKKDKIDAYLHRIIDNLGAEQGFLFLVEDKQIIEVYENRINDKITLYSYNKDIIDKVIEDKYGLYMIDWKDVKNSNNIIDLPTWDSILAVPIIRKEEIAGILYLTVSTHRKEFGNDDLNFANVYSGLLHL